MHRPLELEIVQGTFENHT